MLTIPAQTLLLGILSSALPIQQSAGLSAHASQETVAPSPLDLCLTARGAQTIGSSFHLEVSGGLPGSPGLLLVELLDASLGKLRSSPVTGKPASSRVIPFEFGDFGESPPLALLSKVPAELTDTSFAARALTFDRLGRMHWSPSLNVSFGQGAGHLKRPFRMILPTQRSLFSLNSGDLNRDGFPDLVGLAIDSSGLLDSGVAVGLGNGRGTFSIGTPVHLSGSGSGGSTELVDIDGDGQLDLVVFNPFSNTAQTFLGSGDGSFEPLQSIAMVSGPSTQRDAFVLDDLNGDGLTDLAIAGTGTDQLELHMGQIGGVFGAPILFATGEDPISVHNGDFDGDGIDDLLLLNIGAGGETQLFPGLGGGTYGSPTSLPCPKSVYDSYCLDFTGDGMPDVLIADTCGLLLRSSSVGGIFTDTRPVLSTSDPLLPAFGDVNEDGHLDIVYVENGPSRSLQIEWVAGDGAGGFTSMTGSGFFGLIATDYLLLDVDSDGHLDLLGRDQNSAFAVIGDGTGAFHLNDSAVAFTTQAAELLVADLENDQVPDAVFPESVVNMVIVLPDLGSEISSTAVLYPTGRDPRQIVIRDWNGDGDLDLAVSTYRDDDVTIHLGPSLSILGSFPAGNGPLYLATEDLDFDGNLDLLVGLFLDSNTAVILYGVGDGTFSAATPLSSNSNGRGVGIGHFDDDLLPDIAVASQASTCIYYGQPGGAFGSAAHQLPVPSSPAYLSVGDLDGDGLDDIVVSSDGNGSDIFVFFSDPERSVAPLVHIKGTKGGMNRLAIVDVDGNGSLELMAQNEQYGYLEIFTARERRFAPALRTNLGGKVAGFCVIDLDADGAAEVLGLVSPGSAGTVLLTQKGVALTSPNKE